MSWPLLWLIGHIFDIVSMLNAEKHIIFYDGPGPITVPKCEKILIPQLNPRFSLVESDQHFARMLGHLEPFYFNGCLNELLGIFINYVTSINIDMISRLVLPGVPKIMFLWQRFCLLLKEHFFRDTL